MSLLSVSIKDRAKCYATLHLNIHEYLRSYNVCKVLNKEDYITLKQTTSLLKKNVLVLSLNIIWHDLLHCHIEIYPFIIHALCKTNAPSSFKEPLF